MTIERSVQVKAEAVTLVPDDVRVLLRYESRDRDFRVTRIEERILGGRYAVWLSGPLQTLVGKDHSTHTGFRVLEEGDQVPTELAHLVLGEAELLRLLREAGEGR